MNYCYGLFQANFFENKQGGAISHALGIIDGLTRNGHLVTVLAGDCFLNYSSQVGGGVNYKFVSGRRFSFFFNLLFQLYSIAKSSTDDICFIYRKNLVSLFLMPLAIVFFNIKFSRRVVFCAEVNGLSFESFEGSRKEKLLEFFGVMISKLLLRFNSSVYVVNEELKRKISSGWFGVEDSKVIVVDNGGPEQRFISWGAGSDVLDLFFFGKFQPYNDYDLIHKAIRGLTKEKNERLKIWFIGFGPQDSHIRELFSGMPNCQIVGSMSNDKLLGFISDNMKNPVGIIPMKSGNADGVLFPIKAFDYFSLAVPVIYADNCLGGGIGQTSYGYSYVTNDCLSLAAGISYFIESLRDGGYEHYHERLKLLYPDFTWRSRMSILTSFIESRNY